MNTLLMPFLDESESFVHGFECGQIWQRISEGDTFEGQPIHTINEKQIIIICESFGAKYVLETADDGWSYLKILSINI